MTQAEKLAQVEKWIDIIREAARQLLVAVHDRIPEGWRESKSLEAYQFDGRCYEFQIFGLEQLKKAIEAGDV